MYGFIITTAGEGLLARASAGEGLTLIEVWVGKGAVESAAAAKALTALLDPVAKATSTTPAVAGGQISMLVEYRNDMGGGLEEGFTLSEFGVMAKVGEDAPTLLYYAALGDRAQPVPPIAEGRRGGGLAGVSGGRLGNPRGAGGGAGGHRPVRIYQGHREGPAGRRGDAGARWQGAR